MVRLLCASGANPVLPNSTRVRLAPARPDRAHGRQCGLTTDSLVYLQKQTTPVLVASSHDHVGVAQTTIDHDFSSLNGRDSRGRSPLHTSTRTHNPTLTDTLCEHEKVEPCSLDVVSRESAFAHTHTHTYTHTGEQDPSPLRLSLGQCGSGGASPQQRQHC